MHMTSRFNIRHVPQHHPDCCVALSGGFIELLASHLPKSPELVLSIGCGSGLLEFLLQSQDDRLDLRAIEVDRAVPQYLPESCVSIVDGTWATHPVASEAAAWMFVYPREPKLVRLYIERHMSPLLRSIVWIGPRNDWSDYERLFEHPSWEVKTMDNSSMIAYEVTVLIRLP
ncbi:hypothetical protein ANO11243_068950 [Dothideomycetidae sp. 11243]|nr:hypothetical protein ANO11243_068950 [fungal sp. No.11243]